MSESPSFVLPAAVAEDMSEVIAKAIESFLADFTVRLFPDCRELMTQECIANGVADGLLAYQQRAGVVITTSIVQRWREAGVPGVGGTTLQ